MRRLLGMALALAAAAMVAAPLSTPSAHAAARTSDASGRADARGATGLWLTPAGQAALPDPTQPLCTFIWTATWKRTGYDASGWDNFLYTKWGNTLTCQLQAQHLTVSDDFYNPDYKRLRSVSASCDSCAGPLSAVLPDYDCRPCNVVGHPIPGQESRNWQMNSHYTVTFTLPAVNLYEWATVGTGAGGQGCAGALPTFNGTPGEIVFTYGPCDQIWRLEPTYRRGDEPSSWVATGNGQDWTKVPVEALGPVDASPSSTPASSHRPSITNAATTRASLPMTAGLVPPTAAVLVPIGGVSALAAALRIRRRRSRERPGALRTPGPSRPEGHRLP